MVGRNEVCHIELDVVESELLERVQAGQQTNQSPLVYHLYSREVHNEAFHFGFLGSSRLSGLAAASRRGHLVAR